MCSLHRIWCIILFPQHTCCPSALLCSILDEFIIISIIIIAVVTIIISIIMAGLVLWSGHIHPKRKSLPQRARNLNRRDPYLCKSMLALQECLLWNTSVRFVLELTKIGLSAGVFLHSSAFNLSVLWADWTWRRSRLKISEPRDYGAAVWEPRLTPNKYDAHTKKWIYADTFVNKQHSHGKLSKSRVFFLFTFRVSLNGKRVGNNAGKFFLIIETSQKWKFISQIYLKFTGLGNRYTTD